MTKPAPTLDDARRDRVVSVPSALYKAAVTGLRVLPRPVVLAVAAGSGLLVWLLPALASPLLTMLLRGTVLTALYGGTLLLLGLVPEARPLLQKLLKR